MGRKALQHKGDKASGDRPLIPWNKELIELATARLRMLGVTADNSSRKKTRGMGRPRGTTQTAPAATAGQSSSSKQPNQIISVDISVAIVMLASTLEKYMDTADIPEATAEYRQQLLALSTNP